MSSKVLFYTGLIGIATTIPFFQMILQGTSYANAVTQTSIAIDRVTGATTEFNPQDRRLTLLAQSIVPKALEYLTLGVQKLVKKDYKGGLADIDRAIQIDPNFSFAYNARGAVKYLDLGDVQGGLADFNRALQLNPNLETAYNNRGLLKSEKLNDVQGGLADFNRAIQINPNYANAYERRGIVKASKLNDVQGGLADINRAIQLDPKFSSAYASRGELKYDRLNDRAGGITDTQQAAKLSQQQGNTEDYQKAIEQLKKWQQAGKNPNR